MNINNPENNVSNPLPPFRFWCQTVIPLVYDNSLSYYELLCKVVKQLNDTINAVNNNGSAVTELQQLFVELKDYVDNYFTSSDFTQLVNNRLDEMVEDGTLTQLLQNIIDDTYIFTFKTYNDMISFNLSEGNICRTMGYETVNDGGNALYQITTNATDGIYNTALNNGKTATKLVEDKTNILSFGIKPTQDISNSINVILSKEHTLYLNEGTYTISVDTRILPQSNQNIIGNNTVIKIPGNYRVDYYNMLNLQNVENVLIENITFDGSKANSLNDSGTGGNLIVVGTDTSNITINKCIFKNSWYDGIIVDNYSSNYDNNVEIKNCSFDANGRNGISIGSAINVTIHDCDFQNINGDKAPQLGIDIEPYSLTNSKLNNINIYNINIYNCYDGIAITLDNLASSNNCNISISNIHIDCNNVENARGLYLGYYNNSSSHLNLLINNVTVENAQLGINISDFNKNYNVEIKNITLLNVLQGIHFTSRYTWSQYYGGILLDKIRIFNSPNLQFGVKFDTINTQYTPFNNITIKDINTSNIQGWNLLQNSTISNGLTKTITSDETLSFNEYYDLYRTSYAMARFTLPNNTTDKVSFGVPININLNWGEGSLLGKFQPNTITGTNGFQGVANQMITLCSYSNTGWIIKSIVGGTTPLN